MKRAPDIPDLGPLKDLLLEAARQHTVEGVMTCMAQGACRDRPNVLAVGVWMLEPRPDDATELVLAASGSKADARTRSGWSKASQALARVALDEPIIGQVAKHRKGRIAADGSSWRGGRPAWAKAAGFTSYFAEPVFFQGELLGAIAVFRDIEFSHPPGERLAEARKWIRLFADFTGANIANAKAFQEIEHLKEQLALENEYLREEVRDAQGFGDIIGKSPTLQKCLGQVDLVAPTEASVLITGESGTGKELIARAIHERSPRRGHPLIKVNCASVPRELFESEFFGHVKGAFTGAIADRRGRFQLADHGTLFLDEIGEIPPELQSKLLRVLQEGAFERVGEESTRHVNVRLLAATNRDLLADVATKRFREDLYYRLSVFPIETVPLRDRLEDIPLLTEHFLKVASRQLGCENVKPTLKKKHIAQLQAYSWPGNIRELQNVVQRAVILARRGPLQFDLPAERPAASRANGDVMTYKELRQLERTNLRRALELTKGRIFGPEGAAQLLLINPTTLASRIKSLAIERPRRRRLTR